MVFRSLLAVVILLYVVALVSADGNYTASYYGSGCYGATCTTTPSPPSGGGGGSGGWRTYDYSDEEFSDKGDIVQRLGELERIRILFEGTYYYIGVERYEQGFSFLIEPTDQRMKVSLGESRLIDLNGDGPDLTLAITAESAERALVHFTPIVPETPSEIPPYLLDITFAFESERVTYAGDLIGIATFQRFGTQPVNANLTYTVYTSSNESVYQESENILITSEEVLRKEFTDLAVSPGEYTLQFTIKYGPFTESFSMPFVIEGPFFSPLTKSIVPEVVFFTATAVGSMLFFVIRKRRMYGVGS